MADQDLSVFNMTPGVTPISHDIYTLHMTIFLVCVAIGVLVFGVLIYSLIFHRKSRGHKAAHFHEHLGLEFAWTLVPFVILVAMAVPATTVLARMYDTSSASLNIKVTGFQWKWQYEYLDQGIRYFSVLSTPQEQIANKAPKNPWYLLEVDKPLVVPIHRKVRFLVTSNDVIHSWWVPALGIKRDAIPGFIYEAWARIEVPGTYRGQCAELCGVNHAFMPIVVKAVSEKEFDAWITAQTKATQSNASETGPVLAANTTAPAAKANTAAVSQADLMTQGKVVYEKTCAACHKVDGSGTPPVFPALIGSKIATGPVAQHIDIVLNGKAGTAMQAFKTQLSDAELAAVITYERNAFGNNDQTKYGKDAGGIVQPADIAKAK